MKIFISHIIPEAELALKFKEIIEGIFPDSCEVFVSQRIVPGIHWVNEIKSALMGMDLLILISSTESLKRPWINFEAGCGWIRGVDILPICHSGQKKDDLPHPINNFQALKIEEENFVQLFIDSISTRLKQRAPSSSIIHTSKISKELFQILTKIQESTYFSRIQDLTPKLLSDNKERTNWIVADMSTLLKQHQGVLRSKTIRFCGFLSIFAITSDDTFLPEDEIEKKAILEERDSLIELAKQSCQIKCIICPPNPNLLKPKWIDAACERLKNLINFLSQSNEYLNNIHWAISEVEQKNLYIIDNISYFEGYKTESKIGYGITIRQRFPEGLEVLSSVYDKLFDELQRRTLDSWGKNENDLNSANVKKAVIKCLSSTLRTYSK